MTNDIKVSIKLSDGMPVLWSSFDGQKIGATWDGEIQRIVFERADELKDLDMMLMLDPGRKEDWKEVNIGINNEYLLTNAYTQKEQLKLQVAFFEGGIKRMGSINSLLFHYAKAPPDGAVPKEIVNEYKQLLSDAIVNGAEVEGKYEFYSSGGRVKFTLPASGGGGSGADGTDGKSAYEIAVDNGFTGTEAEWLESLKGADGKDGSDGITTLDELLEKFSMAIDDKGYLYVEVEDGKELYTLTVNNTQLEATNYTVEEIAQDDYKALASKVSDTLYIVQPNDAESGKVYFLGDTAVDTAIKDNTVVYTRNLLKGTSDKITTAGGGDGNHTVTQYYFYTQPNQLKEAGIQPNEYIACMWSWKAESSDGTAISGYLNPICSGSPNYLRTSTTILETTGINATSNLLDRCVLSDSFANSECTLVAQIDDGTTSPTWTNNNSSRMGIYLGDVPTTINVEIWHMKFSRSNVITEWTVAPEDILA